MRIARMACDEDHPSLKAAELLLKYGLGSAPPPPSDPGDQGEVIPVWIPAWSPATIEASAKRSKELPPGTD